MNLTTRINSFHILGNDIRQFLSDGQSAEWNEALKLAEYQNGWFSRDSILNALRGIEGWLTKPMLEEWIANYPEVKDENKKLLSVNVIMAGNIPLVGFHDFLSVLITGNIINAKLSSTDNVLMNFIVKKLTIIDSSWANYINIVDKVPQTADAVIATGSNNTARHFEYYFRNMPHIIRKNRNGVAIFDGSETADDIAKLGKDIFSYFGLGCRNISKLYVPQGYDFAYFFRAIEPYKDVINHHKYTNNYNYNRTIFLMDAIVFTDNGFLMVTKHEQIASPIAVLYFEEYTELASLAETLIREKEKIQCVAANETMTQKLHCTKLPFVPFGQTQSPSLTDYADGVDVIKFILSR